MNYNYTMIDEAFINKISEKKREKLKDTMYRIYINSVSKNTKKLSRERYFNNLNRAKSKILCSYCVYCKRIYLLSVKCKLEELKSTKFCVFCGESNIYDKADYGLTKINNLIEVCNRLNESTDKELINDLNQQILVLIASKMEVFFRDYYKTFLNMKIVRRGHSEIDRFEKDCKNDFINMDKTNDRFKKELGVNLKSIIKPDKYKAMKEMSAYRNVIVHNNGLCDKKFLSCGISNYNEGDPVEIKSNSINQYLKITKEITVEIGNIYEQIYINELIKELEYSLSDDK